jgi:hypothetical protein
MKKLPQIATEAFGISATLMVLGVIGLALDGGLVQFLAPSGLIGLGGAFLFFYIIAFLWTAWFYRRR